MITIYKASAGSGKTYRLTYVYLTQMLGKRDESGQLRLCGRLGRHRDILAITFTNKATEEMKRRIVHELAVLARMEPGWTKPSKYLKDLTSDLHCTAAELESAAREALFDLLFDFNEFNVSTIDAFFQTVMRSFAREAEIAGNYELELDQDEVVTQGLNLLLDDVSQEDVVANGMTQRMAWIIQFMRARLNEAKAFNVFDRSNRLFDNLTKLIKNLLDETFSLNAAKMIAYLDAEATGGSPKRAGSSRISRFASELRARNARLKNLVSSSAAEIVSLAEAEGVYGSFHASLRKWLETCSAKFSDNMSKYVSNAADNPRSVITGKSKQLVSEAFCSQLSALCDKIAAAYKAIETDQFVSANLYEVGLLGDVLAYIKQYCSDNNLLLISDTADMLRLIIGDNRAVAPFLYERIGQRLNHFLIDEFQDTSRMQWHNLRPLIDESNSNGNDNLIIGDEKQSIYRFRNSDPQLLQSQVGIDFPEPASCVTGNTVDGNTNWRSSADIVRFNNTFFTAMAREMGGEDIYAGVVQQVAPKNLGRRGYVSVACIEAKDRDEFEQKALERLAENIKRQLASGYSPSDITVLTRKSREAARVISYLFELMNTDPTFPRLNVISDDSLFVERSPAVRLIVSTMRWLAAPDAEEGTTRASSDRRTAYFISRYQFHRNHAGETISAEEALAKAAADLTSAPDPAKADELRAMSLESLVERIIAEIVPQKAMADECVFITAFQDIIADYIARGDGDLASFLEWWDNTGHKATVSSSQDASSLLVMTIHKAKGLEFPCVHIPFASWSVRYDGFEWCPMAGYEWVDDPDIVPPMLPLEMSKKMLDMPQFAGFYNEFISAVDIDELNLLYVAFTRAVDELCVTYSTVSSRGKANMGPRIKNAVEAITPAMVGERWQQIKAMLPDGTPSVLIDAPAESSPSITVGEPTQYKSEEMEPKTLLDPDDGGAMPRFAPIERPDVWSLIEVERDEDFSLARDRGTIMHRVMESVSVVSDIRPAVERLIARGLIPSEKEQEIVEHLQQQTTRPETRRWFEGFKRALIERPIVFDNTTARPDRVVWTDDGYVDVVDYKFGAENNSAYSEQVRGYMRLLSAAGVSGLRGYIWYLDSGKIVSVEMP